MTRMLSSKLASLDNGRGIAFHCPGCNDLHILSIASDDSDGGPRWGWNTNIDRPTFTPSILVRSGHFAPHWQPGSPCWCTYNKEDGVDDEHPFKCVTCHSFVTDGVIQFLPDCTHELAGRSVEIPVYPCKEQS